MSDQSNESFQTYIEQERERITEARHHLNQVAAEFREKLEQRQAELDHEFAAIDAYERAKTGKSIETATVRTPRRRWGDKRKAVLAALDAAPVGMTRGELLEVSGVKGDKSSEMSISNTLTALRKAGEVTRTEDGRWVKIAVHSLQAAAE